MVERYEYLESLGQGHHGRVYKAKDLASGDVVAIKVIDLNFADSRRATYEVDNHQRLDHENVIHLREVFVVKERFVHLVMDFATVGTLRTYLESNGPALSEATSRKIFVQLINALEYCHKRQVISRDVKLGNILLTEGEDPMVPLLKLCDFGFSKHLKEHSLPKSLVGTIDSVAPEVILSGSQKAYDGCKADIWSCGVVLYQLVTGRSPFSGGFLDSQSREPQELIMARALCGNFTYPEEGLPSTECRNLIDKCLSVDTQQRASIPFIKSHPWFCHCNDAADGPS
ncbi:hypothetical protein BSKO_12879 [Bryopsis sp. KO-2023]|nr:hypothetical protein BSKO_12879 [Bryopsis sp. KO-2023]